MPRCRLESGISLARTKTARKSKGAALRLTCWKSSFMTEDNEIIARIG